MINIVKKVSAGSEYLRDHRRQLKCKNTGLLLSTSVIRRHLHKCIYKGFAKQCKPLVTLKNPKARSDFVTSNI